MGLGPFDLAGGPFLTLYAIMFAAALVAGMIIPRWLRPEGRALRVTDTDQLALLAGGANRFGDALVARLLSTDALAMEGKNKFRVLAPMAGRTEAERGVLRLSSPAAWSAVQLAAVRQAPAIDERLVRDGLMIDRVTALQLRFWQTTPYLLLIAFGAIKWEIGTMRDRPVGFLTAILLIAIIAAVIRFAVVDRRTRGGVAAVQHARAQSDRLRRAPVAEETGLAVALYGTGVLSGSAWSDYHTLRSTSSSDGGSGGDGGGGCGGGGGGGGGCGGCGS